VSWRVFVAERFTLSTVMLSVLMLSVVLSNVAAPFETSVEEMAEKIEIRKCRECQTNVSVIFA
jgi:hypothetical protein